MTEKQVPKVVLTISPPAPVSVNTFSYPAIHTAYISITITETPVLLTLSTQAPSPTFTFLYPTPNSVTHLLYDTFTEGLTPTQTPRQPGLPSTPGVALVDVPYWKSLSCYIVPSILSHASIIPAQPSHTPCFTKLPTLLQGLSGIELTNFCHDRTRYLRSLVDVRYGGVADGLLGELQLAFLVFSVLMVAEGMERWTRLVGELCRADDEVSPGFCNKFADVLQAQLRFLMRCSGDDIVGVIVAELGEHFTRFLDNYPSDALTRLLSECGWKPDYGDTPVVVG